MSTETESALATVRARLAPHGALLGVFDHCMNALRARDDLAVAAKGSLAFGPIDRYSDLDLAVFTRGDPLSEREWVDRLVAGAGPMVTSFPATHLNMPNLLIFFLEVGGGVVKADIELHACPGPGCRASMVILHDPAGWLRRAASEGAPAAGAPSIHAEFADLQRKFCGWIWYTYTKIARGERLEAASSIDVMRERALLPCYHLAHGLPREGYRRAETRMPADALEALERTFPRSRERGELVRALLELAAVFEAVQPRVAEALGREHRTADIGAMVRLVQAEERLHARGSS